MPHFLWVGVGGFIGSVLRFWLSGLVQDWSRRDDFPTGTLAVNVAGCFVIGLLAQLAESRGALTPEARAFLIVGILGGFTTFSTFGNETLNLRRDSETLLAFVNVAAHLILGLGAVWLGRALGQRLWE
jgi:CrcB protein